MNPLPYYSWKQTNGDEAAGEAILRHFPESGTYYLPGMYNDEETITRLYEKGPVAFIHITSREGRPMVEPAMMVRGFVLYLIVAAVIAVLLKFAAPSLPTYGKRVRFAALAGLAAMLLTDFGDAVWWYIPWEWKLHQAAYNLSSWVVAGLVLARVVTPKRDSAA